MKFALIISTLALATLAACSSAPSRGPAADQNYLPPLKNGELWNANDKALVCGENPGMEYCKDRTVWTLQKMALDAKYDELNEIFNHGLSMSSLPVGASAGAGAAFPAGHTKLTKKLQIAVHKGADWLTGANWRGKSFLNISPTSSRGLNRIYHLIEFTVVPTGAFKTYMLDPRQTDLNKYFLEPNVITKGMTSNFVILNYAEPVGGRNDVIEHLLTKIPVFDVMVAVPGKYGPLYVGKTWFGKYNKGEFRPFEPLDSGWLIAWYFLDFNKAALQDQADNHPSDDDEELPEGVQRTWK